MFRPRSDCWTASSLPSVRRNVVSSGLFTLTIAKRGERCMSTQGPAEAETPLQMEVAAATEASQPTEPTASSSASQNVNIKVENTVKASKARSPPLFLSNLPTHILPQILWTRLEIFGSIERLWIERTATGEPTGEATVIYVDDELPDRIVRLQQSIPIFLEGHAISASFRNGLIKPFGDNWVLVYNLPEHITEEDVQRAFARFSPLRIRFKRSPERVVLRTAVRFESKQQANKVVEECARNPLTISDRRLCVLHNGVFVTNSAAGHWLLVRDLPDSANSEDLDGPIP
ncbi:uncharacterized protein LAESUDRAFT_728696 [Laetiporus sulphureus 93-53]|uniref:RRM domain-containing protein n=1 Tax=Laetiporus sulphureus 93-53 TaxID=1314785 RepID=A0A165D1T6_9APHY|nr:uncharacterized protein LAESUDRAFT_728696 [Laetiporus sulphureus 93-53]KZT03981.1 hypothetical protein LAESUDRAFT_728696 [Laetiporus sulphureus 93-53]